MQTDIERNQKLETLAEIIAWGMSSIAQDRTNADDVIEALGFIASTALHQWFDLGWTVGVGDTLEALDLRDCPSAEVIRARLDNYLTDLQTCEEADMPPKVREALAHVRRHIPAVDRVVFWADGSWVYMMGRKVVGSFGPWADHQLLQAAAEEVRDGETHAYQLTSP